MIQVRNVRIGEGIPKICVPLVSGSLGGLLAEADKAVHSGADIAEWRVDYFDDPADSLKVLAKLRKTLGDMPLLFTLRSPGEGGKKRYYGEDYLMINREAVLSGYIDLLDVELFSNKCGAVIEAARKSGVVTVVSSHDFRTTPSGEELYARMQKAVYLGGDIPKLAVTPENPADVLTLLCATARLASENPGQPVITMSMGELGRISRVSGGFFGSSVTFAALDHRTASGQMAVKELRAVLDILHAD